MPGCAKCFGTGSLDAGTDPRGIPITRPCTCQIARDIVRNLNHAWANLAVAPRIDKSPLLGHEGDNLYITATDNTLRAHLRYVGLRAGPSWFFKVVTDSDLMTAWLSPAMMVGKEILDPDAAAVSSEKATLVDLTDPPELMILRLGVKSARNSAMPEVLLEALYHRAHVGKPTWVVDQPTRRFDPSHMAFSDDALNHVNQWERVVLDDAAPGLSIEMLPGAPDAPDGPGAAPVGMSFSAPTGAVGHTQRFDMPTAEPKKSRRKGFNHEG
jgi:hypothetical protein